MIDLFIQTILFTLPEVVIYTFGIIYLLKIRCNKYEKVTAILFNFIFLTICSVIPRDLGIHIPVMLIGLSVIFKAWCNYNIPIWQYSVSIFGIMAVMMICELACGVALMNMVGLCFKDISDNQWTLFMFSVPSRVVEFAILYIFNRRYYV